MPATVCIPNPATEEGILVNELSPGALLEIRTKHRIYFLENQGNGQMWIAGHPRFCPRPVLVKVQGSTWGGSMLRMNYIGPGMHLEYRHPRYGLIRTSVIERIREMDPMDAGLRSLVG